MTYTTWKNIQNTYDKRKIIIYRIKRIYTKIPMIKVKQSYIVKNIQKYL